MTRKLWIVLMIASLLVAAAIPVSSAESGGKSPGGVEPYNGIVGADSPFYGLKLFLQKFDLSLEGNHTAKLQKQLALERERLSEACSVALKNNKGALTAALTEYTAELEEINKTLDSELLDDFTYLNASDELQDQEDSLSNMTNSTDFPSDISDAINQTLNATREIKNGRPFILCNNTTYFIPPGQMKKIANNGTFKTPPGLAKKGYVAPEPLLVNGTVVWPWDDMYGLYTNESYLNATNMTVAHLNQASKHSNGKGNGKGNGNGNNGNNGNGHGKK